MRKTNLCAFIETTTEYENAYINSVYSVHINSDKTLSFYKQDELGVPVTPNPHSTNTKQQ